MVVDTEKILNLITSQIADIVNDDLPYYQGYDIVVEEEELFMDSEDKNPQRLYVVVKFLSAEVDFGQVAVPVTFEVLSEENKLEVAKKLFYEYAERYNLVWNEEKTVQQVYNLPSVVSNFNEIYEGFNSLLGMSGAFLLVDKGNFCTPIYISEYVQGVANVIYKRNDEDITSTMLPYIDFNSFQELVYGQDTNHNDLKIKDLKFENVSNGKLKLESGVWNLYLNDNQTIIMYKSTLHEFYTAIEGNVQENDVIEFDFIDESDIDFLAFDSSTNISLDPQAFYSNNNFTRSIGKFGSFSISIKTYLFDNEFLNKCLNVYLGIITKYTDGIDTKFKFKLVFNNGIEKIKNFRLALFSLSQEKGQVPFAQIALSE